MIPFTVYSRVYRIKHEFSSATCFTIEVDGKLYLITAKHVVKNISKSSTIQIYYNKMWASLDVVLLGLGEGEIDIAVFRPSILFSPISAEIDDFAPAMDFSLGLDAYILGFPKELMLDVGEINRNYPLAFVRKCVISLMIPPETKGQGLKFFLDGYNTPGFSGGPVIFNPINATRKSNYKVLAVVSGFAFDEKPIYDLSQKKHIDYLTYQYNTGIIAAYSIRHALDIIEDNPDGLEVVRNTLPE